MQGWHLETQTKNDHRLDDAKVGEYNLHWHYNGILCSKEKRSQQTTGGFTGNAEQASYGTMPR